MEVSFIQLSGVRNELLWWQDSYSILMFRWLSLLRLAQLSNGQLQAVWLSVLSWQDMVWVTRVLLTCIWCLPLPTGCEWPVSYSTVSDVCSYLLHTMILRWMTSCLLKCFLIHLSYTVRYDAVKQQTGKGDSVWCTAMAIYANRLGQFTVAFCIFMLNYLSSPASL